MFTSQVVKDKAGQNYIMRLVNQGPLKISIKSEKFHNTQASYQFVSNLQVPFGLWQNIASSNSFFSLQSWQNTNPSLSIEHYAAEALVRGSVEVFKLNYSINFSNASADRRFKVNGKVYQIAPAAYLLTNPSVQAMSFNRLEDARSLLNQLAPQEEQVAYLAENLELPIAMNASATKTEVRQALRQALYDGEIVITEEQATRPEPQNIIEEVVEVIDTISDEPPATVASESDSQNEEDPVCELITLTVACAHNGRQQIVTSETGFIPSLDVVASPKNKKGFDKLTAIVDINSPCANHLSSSSSIQPQPEKTTKGTLKNTYQLSSELIRNPLNVLWLPSIKPTRYKISANACERFNPCAVEVNVYPKVKWNIAVGYSFGNEEAGRKTKLDSSKYATSKADNTSDKVDDNIETNYYSKSGKYYGKVELYYDEEKEDFTPEYKDDIDKVLKNIDDVASKVDGFLKKLNDGVYFNTGVKIEVFWPSISVKYEAELLEDTVSKNVNSRYALTISADPLIGLKGSLDLFPVILKATQGTPIGAVVAAAVEGVGNDQTFASMQADIQLILSLDSKVYLNYSVSGVNGKESKSIKSEQAISMEFQFETLIGAKGHVWILKFEKNYRAGIKTGFVGKSIIERDDVGYYWYCRFLFNGLNVIFSKYEKIEKNISILGRKKNKYTKIPSQVENSASKEIVIIKPSPDNDAPNDTATASGSSETQASTRRYLIRF